MEGAKLNGMVVVVAFQILEDVVDFRERGGADVSCYVIRFKITPKI